METSRAPNPFSKCRGLGLTGCAGTAGVPSAYQRGAKPAKGKSVASSRVPGRGTALRTGLMRAMESNTIGSRDTAIGGLKGGILLDPSLNNN